MDTLPQPATFTPDIEIRRLAAGWRVSYLTQAACDFQDALMTSGVEVTLDTINAMALKADLKILYTERKQS